MSPPASGDDAQPLMPARDDSRTTPAGVPLEPFYRPEDAPVDYERDLGDPGSFPFTRGVQPSMYRGRLWTMRQYAGFGTARETNARFRALLAAGQTGLSVAFDLPTQMGIDSDSPRALGEVGRVGVAIDTVDDMHALLDEIPLDKVSTSMTINATAATLLAMYIVVAEERGIARAKLSGTIQNDILKEYIARGTYIYPPGRPRARRGDLPLLRGGGAEWNPISISGYHMREAGATAVQELAFTFANAIEYVTRALAAGLAIDTFAPRLSFFFAAHNDLFEEVAKFRAARRIYARLMRERFGAADATCRLRFHTQTGGVTLTAQQPLNNVVRVTVQALAAVLGGTQSLHTNGYDEALALPTAEAATLALRTQQIVAYETRRRGHRRSARRELLRREAHDGARGARARAARARGRARRRGARDRGGILPGGDRPLGVRASAARRARRDDRRRREPFADEEPPLAIPAPDFRALEQEQVARLARTEIVARSGARCPPRSTALGAASASDNAETSAKLMPLIIDAVRARATLGEIADTLATAWGMYRPGR